MIFCSLQRAEKQLPQTATVQKAVAWLQSVADDNAVQEAIAKLELDDVGRIELDGRKMFALLNHYTTKPRNEAKLESHRKYIDIQYMYEGVERHYLDDVDKAAETAAYNEGKDITFYAMTDTAMGFSLRQGWVAVYFPGDAHAPGLAEKEPERIKKIVVKIAVDA